MIKFVRQPIFPDYGMSTHTMKNGHQTEIYSCGSRPSDHLIPAIHICCTAHKAQRPIWSPIAQFAGSSIRPEFIFLSKNGETELRSAVNNGVFYA
jgi:hypothetical protein